MLSDYGTPSEMTIDCGDVQHSRLSRSVMSPAAIVAFSDQRKSFNPKRRAGRNVQIIVAVVLALCIGLYFWVDSRYPALVKKWHSGTAIKVKGAISFDALLPVDPQSPTLTRIEHTTVNWIWTNRIGM